MKSLIKQLQAATSAVMGETITYARGGFSVSIKATRGRQLTRVSNDVGALIVKGDADWMIFASDLVIDSVIVEPQRGDTITDAGGAVYDVSSTDYSEDVFSYSDHNGHSMRIHARKSL